MLTRTQAKCLDVICAAVARGRPSPTYAEIGAVLGLRSRGRVASLIEDLRERGFITQTFGRPRSIMPLRWRDGSAFDGAALRSVIRAYEQGRAAANGADAAKCPYRGKQAEAWRLGIAAATHHVDR